MHRVSYAMRNGIRSGDLAGPPPSGMRAWYFGFTACVVGMRRGFEAFVCACIERDVLRGFGVGGVSNFFEGRACVDS